MIADCLLLFALGLVAIISPGPDCALIIRSGLSYSRRAALATAAGICSGVAVHLSYCLLGLAIVMSEPGPIATIVRFAGAGYLLYLGVCSIRSAIRREGVSVATVRVTTPPRRAFYEGLLCNLLNPKVAVFFLSLLAQFVHSDTSNFDRVIFGSILWLQSVMYWGALVLVVGYEPVKNLLVRRQELLDGLFGVIMIGFGIGMVC